MDRITIILWYGFFKAQKKTVKLGSSLCVLIQVKEFSNLTFRGVSQNRSKMKHSYQLILSKDQQETYKVGHVTAREKRSLNFLN